jgi:hypothetical protein
MSAHLKSCGPSSSRISIWIQRHTDFGLPGSLLVITARGVPTGHPSGGARPPRRRRCRRHHHRRRDGDNVYCLVVPRKGLLGRASVSAGASWQSSTGNRPLGTRRLRGLRRRRRRLGRHCLSSCGAGLGCGFDVATVGVGVLAVVLVVVVVGVRIGVGIDVGVVIATTATVATAAVVKWTDRLTTRVVSGLVIITLGIYLVYTWYISHGLTQRT